MNIVSSLLHKLLPKAALLSLLLVATGIASCTSFTADEAASNGTVKVGGMLAGAAVGAFVGNQSGRAVQGALLGSWAGGLVGTLTGDSMNQRSQQEESAVANRRLWEARSVTSR